MTDASTPEAKQTTRLIERWLPIAEIGIEGKRERTPMTPFPAPNRLHVWWARRPLVASRAAILASVMSAEGADHAAFTHAIGIHGDPVESRGRIDRARRLGERFEGQAYSYQRAFSHNPEESELKKLVPDIANKVILDATAGGGAIPLEALRLGMNAFANDLNPVATTLLHATLDLPRRHGLDLLKEYRQIAGEFAQKREAMVGPLYLPDEDGLVPTNYIWARTVRCPHCEGLVPLSPNWTLGPGMGVRLVPATAHGVGDEGRCCSFELVEEQSLQSAGTVSDGDGVCPFPDCNRPISGDYIKTEAQAGRMGDQLFAIVVKRRVKKITKTGRAKDSWVREYRTPKLQEDNSKAIAVLLAEKIPFWEAEDILPNEEIPDGNKTTEPHRYGMRYWRDIFNPRQLMSHCTAIEVYRQMLGDYQAGDQLNDVRKAAFVYLAIAIDKSIDYNSRMTRWHSTRGVMTNTFDRHDFAFKWSYAEMAMAMRGSGPDWATTATGKALEELIDMLGAGQEQNLFDRKSSAIKLPTITCGSGSHMPHIDDRSVDCVVIDPPYGANVMYAELSDFFYVWLKRTAGLVMPELFAQHLANKDEEAVANPARFKGEKGAAILANRDYQDKMAAIFKECRRVLKDDGIMTVMFTHKDTGAWDALAISLMAAGFVITASWPVNTEAEGSLHIKDKAAANSTIFLVCRPRVDTHEKLDYWEDVEPLVSKAVLRRIEEFEAGGIRGVDLYLASFGPALEEFSRHWPLTRGTPAPEPARRRRVQADMFDTWDPYAVRPEDALNAARREVKAWRLSKLSQRKGHADLDPPTSWVALAWDAFRAPKFPYDEGLRLARAVGLDLETEIVGRVAEKKGSDLTLWDSATRVAKAALGPADGARGMIDALHHAAHVARTRGVEEAGQMLERAGLIDDDSFKTALEVMLEVLPPSRTYTGFDLDKTVQPAADDFDALEKIRRILFADEIDAPKQLDLFKAPEPVA